MNPDMIKSTVSNAAMLGLGWMASRYHLSGETIAAVSADAGTAAVFAYSWYAHFGTKKVPASAQVAMPGQRVVGAAMMLALMFGLLYPVAGRAADLPRPLPVKAVAQPTTLTGWYAGAGINGIATSVDVIGQGILGSLTAGGAVFDVHAGAVYFNGTYMFGAEVGVGYETSRGAAMDTLGTNRINAYQLVQLGGTLSNLLGTPAPAASVPTFSLGNLMAQSVPFVQLGMWERGSNAQQVTGAGVMLPLTDGWFTKVGYVYGAPMDTLPQFNMVTVGVNKIFK